VFLIVSRSVGLFGYVFVDYLVVISLGFVSVGVFGRNYLFTIPGFIVMLSGVLVSILSFTTTLSLY